MSARRSLGPQRSVTQVLGTSTGGVGVHVRSVTAGLVDRGWSVQVLGPHATDELFGFTAAGATFVPVEIGAPVPGPGLLRCVRAVRAAAPRAGVVHAHGLRATVVCVLARRRPLLATWHNLVLDEQPGSLRMTLRRRIAAVARGAVAVVGERAAARGATVSLGASQDLVERIAALGGRDVRLAPVAATLTAAARDPAAVRRELGIDDGALLLVTVARLHPQKGLEVLIAALDARARDPHAGGPAVQAVIAGSGPLEHELAGRISDTGAPVRLLGRRDDVADLLSAADLVVLPSRWEARSLVAQEALLAGRPLIATDVGGLPELLGDGALLVPPGDPRALREAIDQLASDPQERAALARRGAQRAAGWPTEADTVNQLDGVYRELLARVGASGGK
ncbi:MAG: glycosyl transferase group 1 [Jatrophihabitantaceae bacterium]|nr:glycosyl transferase group 1 [Jatrophihabitantaceae bacterium]